MPLVLVFGSRDEGGYPGLGLAEGEGSTAVNDAAIEDFAAKLEKQSAWGRMG